MRAGFFSNKAQDQASPQSDFVNNTTHFRSYLCITELVLTQCLTIESAYLNNQYDDYLNPMGEIGWLQSLQYRCWERSSDPIQHPSGQSTIVSATIRQKQSTQTEKTSMEGPTGVTKSSTATIELDGTSPIGVMETVE